MDINMDNSYTEDELDVVLPRVIALQGVGGVKANFEVVAEVPFGRRLYIITRPQNDKSERPKHFVFEVAVLGKEIRYILIHDMALIAKINELLHKNLNRMDEKGIIPQDEE